MGAQPVIAAEQYARGARSMWRALAPMMWEFGGTIEDRAIDYGYGVSASSNSPQRNALLSEAAFELAVDVLSTPPSGVVPFSEFRRRLVVDTGPVHRAWARVSLFLDAPEPPLKGLDPAEVQEVGLLAQELVRALPTDSDVVVTRPRFPGCGLVDAAEGDLLIGTTLYEVKAVSRGFRSSDLMQVLMYLTLNRAAGSSAQPLTRVALVNPRRGELFAMDCESLSWQVAGKSETELLDRIVEYISAPGASS